MKKILLIGILLLSKIIFGKSNESIGIPETTINVSAKVLAPLTLRVDQVVNFGVVMQGQSEKYNKDAGFVHVKGEPEAIIRLFARGNTQAEFIEGDTTEPIYSVKLIRQGASDINDPREYMIANLGVLLLGADYKDARKLSKTGETDISIGGWLSARNDQTPGKYLGEIYVRVMYE